MYARSHSGGYPIDSDPSVTQIGAMDRWRGVAAYAIVGQVILTASAWLLPIVSEYHLIGDNISELVLGRYGFIQTAAFLIAGSGTIALAVAVRALTAGSRASLAGAVLVAIYGVGALLSAIFQTDRIDGQMDLASLTTSGIIHIVVALVSFPCAVIFMFVLAQTFRCDVRWRSLSSWSNVCASGTLALLFLQAEGPWVGLMQRLLVGIITIWLILVASRMRSIAARVETSQSAQPTMADG